MSTEFEARLEELFDQFSNELPKHADTRKIALNVSQLITGLYSAGLVDFALAPVKSNSTVTFNDIQHEMLYHCRSHFKRGACSKLFGRGYNYQHERKFAETPIEQLGLTWDNIGNFYGFGKNTLYQLDQLFKKHNIVIP